MEQKKNTLRSGAIKTLLIIVGILIALLMTLNSPLFGTVSEWLPAEPAQAVEDTGTPTSDEPNISGTELESATRMFHIFTNNLPYLNNK